MQVALGQVSDEPGSEGGEEANGLLSAAIASIRTVSAFSMQEGLLGSYRRAIAPLATKKKLTGVMSGVIFGLTQFVMFGTYGLLFWYGGNLVSEGKKREGVRGGSGGRGRAGGGGCHEEMLACTNGVACTEGGR